MKEKLRDYIDMIFADAPDSIRARELKDEMYANVCDRYDDLIAEGKSESAAYNICVSGIGDISELIESLREGKEDQKNPYDQYYEKQGRREYTEEEKAQIEKYRVRSGVMTSIAVALYIICWVPLVWLSTVSTSGRGRVVGIAIMMIIVAAATAILIFKSAFKPLCLKEDGKIVVDDDEDDDDKGDDEKNFGVKRARTLNIIRSTINSLTVAAYLLMGFLQGLWHPGWIIFLFSVAVNNVITAIFELVGKGKE